MVETSNKYKIGLKFDRGDFESAEQFLFSLALVHNADIPGHCGHDGLYVQPPLHPGWSGHEQQWS